MVFLIYKQLPFLTKFSVVVILASMVFSKSYSGEFFLFLTSLSLIHYSILQYFRFLTQSFFEFLKYTTFDVQLKLWFITAAYYYFNSKCHQKSFPNSLRIITLGFRKSKQNAIIFIWKQVNKIENVLTMLNFLWNQISFVYIVSLTWFVSILHWYYIW